MKDTFSLALFTDGVSPYVTGGMQDHSRNILEYFASRGHKVYLFHTSFDLVQEAQELSGVPDNCKRNIIPFYIPFPRHIKYPGHYLFESYIYSKRIYKAFNDSKIQCDFIYAQGFTAWYFLEKDKSKKDYPKIGINLHGLNMLQPTFGLKAFLNAKLLRSVAIKNLRLADFVFSLGGELTNILKKCGIRSENILQVPGAINSDWLFVEKENHYAFRFLFVGRYDAVKGIDILFKAWSNFNKHKGIELHYVGPFPEHLKGKYSDVHFYGEVKEKDQIKSIYANCDILLSTSYSEGMPVAVMEAMAVGLPVIATNVGATSELIQHNVNGFLIPPGNSEELIKQMEYVIDLPPKSISEIGKNGKLQIEKFHTWDKIGEKTHSIIINNLL